MMRRTYEVWSKGPAANDAGSFHGEYRAVSLEDAVRQAIRAGRMHVEDVQWRDGTTTLRSEGLRAVGDGWTPDTYRGCRLYNRRVFRWPL